MDDSNTAGNIDRDRARRAARAGDGSEQLFLPRQRLVDRGLHVGDSTPHGGVVNAVRRRSPRCRRGARRARSRSRSCAILSAAITAMRSAPAILPASRISRMRRSRNATASQQLRALAIPCTRPCTRGRGARRRACSRALRRRQPGVIRRAAARAARRAARRLARRASASAWLRSCAAARSRRSASFAARSARVVREQRRELLLERRRDRRRCRIRIVAAPYGVIASRAAVNGAASSCVAASRAARSALRELRAPRRRPACAA